MKSIDNIYGIRYENAGLPKLRSLQMSESPKNGEQVIVETVENRRCRGMVRA